MIRAMPRALKNSETERQLYRLTTSEVFTMAPLHAACPGRSASPPPWDGCREAPDRRVRHRVIIAGKTARRGTAHRAGRTGGGGRSALEDDVFFFLPCPFLQVALRAGKLQVGQIPFVAPGCDGDDMVHMEVLFADQGAALHADAAVAHIDHLAYTRPVREHEEVPQAAGPAEGVAVVQGALAAHAAEHPPFLVLAARKALLVAASVSVAHGVSSCCL